MDENVRMEINMDEIIANLETLFEENPEKYNMEKLQKYLKDTKELIFEVNRIKDAIQAENPGISHEDLIKLASERVAEMVQMQEMEAQNQEQVQENDSNEDR